MCKEVTVLRLETSSRLHVVNDLPDFYVRIDILLLTDEHETTLLGLLLIAIERLAIVQLFCMQGLQFGRESLVSSHVNREGLAC